MTAYPKGNVLPDHVRIAIRAYLKKASRERPVVISRAVREIQSLSKSGVPDGDLTTSIATEAIEAGLNIHFDGPDG